MIKLNLMRSYELILVVKTSLTDTLRKKLITGVKSLLKDLKIIKENEVGIKQLAYKIKREANGFYFDFTLEGETMPRDFEKKLLENENILRHLVLRTKCLNIFSFSNSFFSKSRGIVSPSNVKSK